MTFPDSITNFLLYTTYITACPATKPRNVSYVLMGSFINISWIPPENTYKHPINNYVVFVGDHGDNVSESEIQHLRSDDRYTIVSRNGILLRVNNTF